MRMFTSSDQRRRTLFACLPSKEVLDHVASVLMPESLLSQPDRARAEALTGPVQRRDFVAARVLTRLMLREWHGPRLDLSGIAEYVLEQSCDACGGPHGRPADVGGVAVSWAHSGGFVAAAVGEVRVGVDVEPLVAAQLDRPDGASALRAWVRGEAIVKWGYGSLDESLAWRPFLDGPPASLGQRYVFDGEGHPLRRRGPFARAPRLVITDASAAVAGALCSVAAERAARWVNPLL
jgi:4'-phosphopantetheinyl transferase